MTTEEAIKILDPATSHAALMAKMGGIWNQPFALALIERAQTMGLEALRAQTDFNGTYVNVAWLKQVEAERDVLKNAKLDRSLWKGCQYCEADSEGYSTVFKDDTGRSRRLYIPEGEAAIVLPGKYNHKAYIKIGYCPFCGKPLTEEAWVELERRINGGKTD